MAGAWDLWQAEIANPTPEDRRLDRPTDPALMSGFWRRMHVKTRHDDAIVINDGKWAKSFTVYTVIADDMERWQRFIEKDWLYCVAVSREEIALAISTGFWPDGRPAKPMTEAEKYGVDLGASGGNQAPVEEVLADQIAALAEKLAATSKPADKAQADALADNLKRMKLLLDKAEATRKTEKEPHWLAGKAVDERWKAVADPGATASAAAEKLLKSWLRDEQAKLDAANAAANANTNKQAEQLGMEPIPASELPPPEKAKAGGTYSRATSLRKVKKGKIVDMAAFLTSMVENDMVVELAQRLANLGAKAGLKMAGVEIVEEME